MEKHHWEGILIIFIIISIVAFGGVKNTVNNGVIPTPSTPGQTSTTAKTQLESLQNQTAKTESVFKGLVSISYVNRNTNPSQEYVTIKVSGNAKKNVPITGWKLASLSSGASVTIPKGTYLFFINTTNASENISLSPGETLYIVTGSFPNVDSFKVNKCSGYITQSQSFIPYLSSNCPLAKNEDLSKIPRYVNNDGCFNYIDSYQRCKVETGILPVEWSPECKDFITNKLNYPSCVNTHKNDKDFYLPEWRVFLKRSQSVWKSQRENIVLYDNFGKIVDSYSY